MGVLIDAGILTPEKKVTDNAFRAFIKDVKNKLATGQGLFPEGTGCAEKITPNASAKLLRLERQKEFPEFHRDWRTRYENAAASLDVEGAAGLAQQTGQPAVDPSFAAVSIGAIPPKMELAEAIASIVTPPLPPALLELIAGEDGNGELLDPLKQPDNLANLTAALAIPPVPPVPILPDPIILELGYTEQFSYELELALAPIKAHIAGMVPTAVLELPSGLGNLPFGLIEPVCKEIKKNSPQTIEGADFQKAANDVMNEHMARFGVLAKLGQNIGTGVITNGLAAAPFADGGLEMLIDAPEEEEDLGNEFEILTSNELLSSRRIKALQIIKAVLGEPPIGKPVFYPDSKFSEISNWKPGADVVKEQELRSAAKKLQQKAAEMTSSTYTGTGEKTMSIFNPDWGKIMAESGKADFQAGKKIKEADDIRKDRLSKPVVTTCGALPPYLLAKLGLTYYEGAVKIADEFQSGGLTISNLLAAGLESLRIAARALGCWEEAIYQDENDNVSKWTGKLPKPGDLYMLTGNQAYGTSQKWAYEYDLNPVHVGVIIDIIGKYTEGDTLKWVTADAGQGFDGDVQGAQYLTRTVIQGPTLKGGPLIQLQGEIDSGGGRPIKILSGWVNIDKVSIKNENS